MVWSSSSKLMDAAKSIHKTTGVSFSAGLLASFLSAIAKYGEYSDSLQACSIALPVRVPSKKLNTTAEVRIYLISKIVKTAINLNFTTRCRMDLQWRWWWANCLGRRRAFCLRSRLPIERWNTPPNQPYWCPTASSWSWSVSCVLDRWRPWRCTAASARPLSATCLAPSKRSPSLALNLINWSSGCLTEEQQVRDNFLFVILRGLNYDVAQVLEPVCSAMPETSASDSMSIMQCWMEWEMLSFWSTRGRRNWFTWRKFLENLVERKIGVVKLQI